jgi:hypothetical protein
MKTHVQNLVRELVERRLWPVALLLAVALAAPATPRPSTPDCPRGPRPASARPRRPR